MRSLPIDLNTSPATPFQVCTQRILFDHMRPTNRSLCRSGQVSRQVKRQPLVLNAPSLLHACVASHVELRDWMCCERDRYRNVADRTSRAQQEEK
jgi:hypothetical protein